MSSRIIRGDDRTSRIKVSAPPEGGAPGAALLPQDHIMNIERQAFEQGYREGERAGKQMGERMVDAAVKRYDRSVQNIAESHRALVEAMEEQTVRFALEISKKLIRREVRLDVDLVTALAGAALKRVQGHQSVVLRVSPSDFERVRAFVDGNSPSVSVREDPALERGDFMLDTAQTHIDGRISAQIEAIGRALFDE
jgi:flagellar assembly protein FliH